VRATAFGNPVLLFLQLFEEQEARIAGGGQFFVERDARASIEALAKRVSALAS
jgi:hypothetical protein